MGSKVVEKKIVSFMLTVAMLLSLTVATIPSLTAEAASAKSTTTGFYVDGTKIYDANDNEFIMRGINHAHVWYTGQAKTVITAVAKTGANCIRLVFGDGQVYTKTTASEMQNVIEMCIDNELVPIVEVHDTTGSNSTSDLQACVDYWTQSDVVSVLNKYEKYTILNIANEWYGNWSGYAWAKGYKDAIPQLRSAGINNLLMVDAPGWGQDTNGCINYCNSVFEADTNSNTMFSIHMYDDAGKDDSTVKSGIDGVLGKGVPLVIGEFANDHKGNYVACDYIMEYCQQKGVGYIGWSWKGNDTSLASLDIANDWAGSSYSTWGNKLVNGTNGLKNTSAKATIFGKPLIKEPIVIWEGSASLNWNSAKDTAANCISATEGGTLLIYYTAGGSVQLGGSAQNSSGTWGWVEITNYDDGDAYISLPDGESPVSFVLDSANADALATMASINLKGDKGTVVTKLVYVPAGATYDDSSSNSESSSNADSSKADSSNTESSKADSSSKVDVSSSEVVTGNSITVWEGSQEITWSSEAYLSISNIVYAREGGKLKFTYEPSSSASAKKPPQIQFVAKLQNEWVPLEGVDPEDPEEPTEFFTMDPDGTEYVYIVTADGAEHLDYSGQIVMKGQNCTLTKIEYICAPGQSYQDGESTELWSGEYDMGKWADPEEPVYEGSFDFEENGILTIAYTPKGADSSAPQLQIATKNAETDWDWTAMPNYSGDKQFTMSRVGSEYNILLTAAQAKALSEAGEIWIKGQLAVVTEIKYTAPGILPGQAVYGDDSSDSDSSSIADSSKLDSSKTDSSKADSSKEDSSSKNESSETVISSINVSDFGWNNNNVLNFNLTGYDSAKIVATGNCSYIKLGIGGAVSWTEIVDGASTNSNGTYTYEFSTAEIAKFSADCELYIQGQDGSLSKVEVIGSNGSGDNSSQTDSSKSDSSAKEQEGTPIVVSDNVVQFDGDTWGSETVEFTVPSDGKYKLVVEYQGNAGAYFKMKLDGVDNAMWNEGNWVNDVCGHDEWSTVLSKETIKELTAGSHTVSFEGDKYAKYISFTATPIITVIESSSVAESSSAADSSKADSSVAESSSDADSSEIESSSEVDISSNEESSSQSDSSSKEDSSSEIETDVDLALVQNTFTLDGMIGANFDYTIPADYVNGDYDIVVSAVSEKNTITVDFDKDSTIVKDGVTAYRFTIPVASCDITETYQVKLTVSDPAGEAVVETQEKEMKVNDYLASYRVGNDQKLRNLASALQTYGYYSQVVFNPEAVKPVSKPNDISDVNVSDVRKYKMVTEIVNTDKKISVGKPTLLLEAETTIRFYVSDLNSVSADDLYMVYNDNGTTVKTKVEYSEAEGYYADIPNIGASKLSNMYTVHFEENDTQVSDNVTYGAYSFVFASFSTSDENLKNLAKSLYKYSLAAKDFNSFTIVDEEESDEGWGELKDGYM